MMKGTVVLSHGLDSGPQATKVSALAEIAEMLGWTSLRPDYRGIDAERNTDSIDARIAHALAHAPVKGRVVFAGSSMGAFVSGFASLARPCEGLFLLALPIDIKGYARRFAAANAPTTLVHGWNDELCPVDAVIAFAQGRRDTLHLLPDDHRLGNHVEYCAHAFREFLQSLE
ncbi:MAG: alpha/beta hydrolase [Rhodanobacteraceae bacterium]